MEKYIRVWTKDGYEDLTIREWAIFDNNKLHREDGPAVEGANGQKEWYLNGKRHREDGPAVEGANGTKEWWLNGNKLPKKEVENWFKDNKVDLTTDEGKMAFKLRWA